MRIADEKAYNWKPAYQNGAQCELDMLSGIEVMHVYTIPALIQYINYIKYSKSQCNTESEKEIKVFFRGQTSLFHNWREGPYQLCPLAFRVNAGGKSQHTSPCFMRKKLHTLKEKIVSLRKATKDKSDNQTDEVLEGLLQQYGIATTWLDAVDNIWIALWFACYKSDQTIEIGGVKSGNKRSYIHMIRRSLTSEMYLERYAYILILGGDMEYIDLRCKLPSFFTRPHAQHGVLVRTKNFKSNPNMKSLILGVVRINLSDALAWLGNGALLEPENIIPPPNYDNGFRYLLEHEKDMIDSLRFPIFC